ncbi:hypothetical protein OGH69_14235 [Flavobacterium sp. MFBS3-15]|uniref:hypothetical protein n=1 Tax=Flavobacterium sp. MFBS3-15 TaxID=2989816 RepID=UPI002236188D|nr:hypothetical protein [Flavobacterium sp. MFBS3-15]MCW4470132.1 hypothetical protein [Flavobacterium sp. MFBS3-15]
MRWSKFLIIVAVTFSLFSCKKAEEKAAVQKEVKLPKMEETFPFSEAEKIELISYSGRYSWDRDRENFNVIVEDKKLVIDTSYIKERIVINEKLEKDLFKAIYIDDPPTESAACFDPRHSILFYNKNSEIIAYIEICFMCGNYETSKNFTHGLMNVGSFWMIFKDAGIKYFKE